MMMKYSKKTAFRFSSSLLLFLTFSLLVVVRTTQTTIGVAPAPGASTYRNDTVTCTTDHRLSTPVCGIYSRKWFTRICSFNTFTSTIVHRKFELWDASLPSFPNEAYVGITVIVSSNSGGFGGCSRRCTIKVESPALGLNSTCDCFDCPAGGITAYCDQNNIELQPYSRKVTCEPTYPVYFPLDPAKISLFQTGSNTKAPSESSDDPEGQISDDDEDDGGLGVGALAGIAAGVAAVVVIIVGVGVVICLQRRSLSPVPDDGMKQNKEQQEIAHNHHRIGARLDKEDATATAAMTQSVKQVGAFRGAGSSATGGSGGGYYDEAIIPESACPPAARPTYPQQVQHSARPPVQQQCLKIVAVEEMVEDILKPDGSMVTEITKTTTYSDGSKMVEVMEMPFEGPE